MFYLSKNDAPPLPKVRGLQRRSFLQKLPVSEASRIRRFLKFGCSGSPSVPDMKLLQQYWSLASHFPIHPVALKVCNKPIYLFFIMFVMPSRNNPHVPASKLAQKRKKPVPAISSIEHIIQ